MQTLSPLTVQALLSLQVAAHVLTGLHLDDGLSEQSLSAMQATQSPLRQTPDGAHAVGSFAHRWTVLG
jgi:hypothetical protein